MQKVSRINCIEIDNCIIKVNFKQNYNIPLSFSHKYFAAIFNRWIYSEDEAKPDGVFSLYKFINPRPLQYIVNLLPLTQRFHQNEKKGKMRKMRSRRLR